MKEFTLLEKMRRLWEMVTPNGTATLLASELGELLDKAEQFENRVCCECGWKTSVSLHERLDTMDQLLEQEQKSHEEALGEVEKWKALALELEVLMETFLSAATEGDKWRFGDKTLARLEAARRLLEENEDE